MRGNIHGTIAEYLTANFSQEQYQIMNDIMEQGFVSARDDNNINRSLLVGMQGKIESNIATALASGKLQAALNVIHTKLPPTPLRNSVSNEELEQLVAASILNDAGCLASVSDRSIILRNYLAQGGRLIALYPEAVLEGEVAGIDNFRKECDNYPDNLINMPHSGDVLDSGGSCLLIDQEGNHSFFAIQASQANEAGATNLSLWFGPVFPERELYEGEDNPNLVASQARYKQVAEYLAERGVDMQEQLTQSEIILAAKRQGEQGLSNSLQV